MSGRGRVGSLAASPTMVGAITTLIVLVAVFLAYLMATDGEEEVAGTVDP